MADDTVQVPQCSPTETADSDDEHAYVLCFQCNT